VGQVLQRFELLRERAEAMVSRAERILNLGREEFSAPAQARPGQADTGQAGAGQADTGQAGAGQADPGAG
jgi:hypothetical protein